MSITDTPSGSPYTQPLVLALTLAEAKKFADAKATLGIAEASINDETFLRELRSLGRGISVIATSDLAQAHSFLAQSENLISFISDADLKELLQILAEISKAVYLLQEGDSVGSLNIMNAVERRLQSVTLPQQELSWATLAIAQTALLKFQLGKGELQEADRISGKLRSIYREAIQFFESNGSASSAHYAEAYGSATEIATTIALCEFSLMQFSSAKRRLEGAQDAKQKLDNLLPQIPDGTYKSIIRAISLTYEVEWALVHAAYTGLESHKRLGKQELRKLAEVPELIFKAEQFAADSGDRGKNYLTHLTNLKIQYQGLTHALQPRKWEPVSKGGISFGLCYIAIIGLGFVSGDDLVWYLTWGVLPSLIVAFGQSAVEFIPLISAFKELPQLKQQTKTTE